MCEKSDANTRVADTVLEDVNRAAQVAAPVTSEHDQTNHQRNHAEHEHRGLLCEEPALHTFQDIRQTVVEGENAMK